MVSLSCVIAYVVFGRCIQLAMLGTFFRTLSMFLISSVELELCFLLVLNNELRGRGESSIGLTLINFIELKAEQTLLLCCSRQSWGKWCFYYTTEHIDWIMASMLQHESTVLKMYRTSSDMVEDPWRSVTKETLLTWESGIDTKISTSYFIITLSRIQKESTI